jgi:hypothetical protein
MSTRRGRGDSIIIFCRNECILFICLKKGDLSLEEICLGAGLVFLRYVKSGNPQ